MSHQKFHVAVLAGDGIGPEVMEEALRVLEKISEKYAIPFHFTEALVGGIAIDKEGKALPKRTLKVCEASDAILFGSVGGPKWESLPAVEQPERAALLPLSKHFSLFANLRPGVCLPELTHASPIKEHLIEGGFDVLCVRELTGGMYFGSPKEIREENGESVAVDTMIYRESEIRRIAHVAFQAARGRRKSLTSIDKANVLQNGILWRRVITEIGREYPDVQLRHLYVDNAAMQIMKFPRDFDVILAENMFGDILSDEMAMIAGSLGMLPSASLGEGKDATKRFGMYEPSGGTAPDIAGKNIANPIAQILSAGMMLRYSAARADAADAIDQAVRKVIAEGLRTADIWSEGKSKVSTREMGEAIVQHI